MAPRPAASPGHCLRIVGQPIDTRDPFRDPAGPRDHFPVLEAQPPFTLARQTANILRERERAFDGCIALDEVF